MTVEVTILISVMSLALAFLGYKLNKDKEKREEGEIKAQLAYIGKGVDDIRIDIKANERQVVALGERVTRVEESAKQAHKRLDEIRGGDE